MKNCIYKVRKNKLEKKKENNRILIVNQICNFFLKKVMTYIKNIGRNNRLPEWFFELLTFLLHTE
jgi:hypothetical protein